MGAINISSVGKVYPNGTRALEDVNIEINDGEFVVLVGPSGCGKTTLLRMVAGLEDITEGEISIADNIVNEVAPKDRDIAMVFQNYALYPHMSVYDNMAFSLKLRKLPKDEIEKKVKDAAKTLEIDELLERKPKALSGGQRQRVAMGRAIVRSPQAFLMDEPLSNLDAKLRVQMRAELGQLHTQLETTTLYVTHDQVEAMTMGDRVAVIRKGELQQIDTPREIYLYPKNIFVAGFIGSPSMNFVYADVKISGKKAELSFAGETINCDGESAKKLEKMDGEQIVLGIRPEAFEDSIYAKDSEYSESIDIKVTLLEQLGSDSYIHFYKDIKPVQTEAIEEILADEGEEIKLSIDSSKLHFFDPSTGNAL